MANIEGKPFTDILGDLENGDLLAEITTDIYALVRAVQDTRKPGAFKLTLKMVPTGRASVEIEADYDVKIPEHDRPNTTFFVDGQGTLLRNDPMQPRLPLREVDGDRRDNLKTVGD
jgi:hypothetical protein